MHLGDIVEILEDALETNTKEKKKKSVGVHHLCGACCSKTRIKVTKGVKDAASKITPMHLHTAMSKVLDHEASSTVRLSKYLDVEDRFIHFNANRTFLRQLLEEIGVEKKDVIPMANSIFDKLPHFNEDAEEEEGPDLSDKMAIRALYNTALETKRNIADAAIKNQQAIIKSKQVSPNRKGNNPTNAKDAWGV